MDEAALNEAGNIDGRLKQIEFAFASEAPMLPFKSMASDMERMSLTMYAVSDYAYYIPGTDITYTEQIPDNSCAHSILDEYDPVGKWPVRTEMSFDPQMIKENIVLSRTDRWVCINDHLPPSDSGVLPGTPICACRPLPRPYPRLSSRKSGFRQRAQSAQV